MQGFGGTKFHIIKEKSPVEIFSELKARGITAGHFTNGTYVAPPEVILPTTLAGFKYVTDQDKNPSALIVAINSNTSMENIKLSKKQLGQDVGDIEDEIIRAEKLLPALSSFFPERSVVALFYDEATPTPLYDFLKESGLGMRSLFKWGYGTDPNAPRIEGAHNFDQVYGFPMLDNDRPLCHDLTLAEDQSKKVLVRALTKEIGLHGAPYISKDKELLFTPPSKLIDFGSENKDGQHQSPAP